MSRSLSLLDRIETNRIALGAWMFFREAIVAGTVSKLGYDFVCVDMQHGMQSFDDLTKMIGAIHHGGAVPLVRSESCDTGLAGRYLDAGAAGIIFPMVNSKEQAMVCVQACHYPPRGERSMGAIGASLYFGEDYFDFSNTITCAIPMIETREAVENIDSILEVDGIDVVFVGPSDLAISYGLSPSNDNPDPSFQAALTRIVERCNAHGVVAGVYSSAQVAQKRIDSGFRLLSISTDWDNAIDGFTVDLRSLES
ncbi:MAG: aldolase/citrate lyase family protein [Albidovulum sp.]|nr:aldolase/citrate lyase family protein [Albidovulum sp.]